MPQIESDTSLAHLLIFVLTLKGNFERKAKFCEIPMHNYIFFTCSEMGKSIYTFKFHYSKCVCIYIKRDKNTPLYIFR